MKVITAVSMVIALMMVACFTTGCLDTQADVASYNLSKDAEEFKITRKISFVNGITDNILLTVVGKCSVEFEHEKFVVICKMKDGSLAKHYMGRSDNSFPIIEQLVGADVNTSHYKVIYRPQSIIPDVDIKGSGKDLRSLLE